LVGVLSKHCTHLHSFSLFFFQPPYFIYLLTSRLQKAIGWGSFQKLHSFTLFFAFFLPTSLFYEGVADSV